MGKVYKLYGRAYELAWLSARLFSVSKGGNAPRVILVYGPSGVGKTRLVEELIAPRGEPEERGTVLAFGLNRRSGQLSLEEFSEALLKSGRTSMSAWQPEVAGLARQFSLRVKALKSEGAKLSEAYCARGQVRAVDAPEAVGGANDPDGIRMAAISADLLAGLFDQLREASSSVVNDTSLLYFFDDYAHYSPPIKRWLGGPFLDAIRQANGIPMPGILLAGQGSWGTEGCLDYWHLPPGAFLSHELAPLSRGSCLQWLIEAGHAPAGIDILMEETEGVPEQVRVLLENPERLDEPVGNESGEEGSAEAGRNAKQRRWLHAAAVAETISEESLQVILGEADGREAFDWLAHECSGDIVGTLTVDGQLRVELSKASRKRILIRFASQVPARHREFQELAELQASIFKAVPSAQHRENLRKLALIQPFNFEMIKRAYGHDE